MMGSDGAPILIGWKEYVDLPEWGIFGMCAKIDTGARSSALHVEDIVIEDDGHVSFSVVRHRQGRRPPVRVTGRITRRKIVRSSTGHSSSRIFVSTTMRMGAIEAQIEISLVDRDAMIHRLLIGRAALACVRIDPSERFLLGKPERRRKTRRGKPPA